MFLLEIIKVGYGLLYTGSAVPIIETLTLIYLYPSIFVMYRNSAKTVMNDCNTSRNMENIVVSRNGSHSGGKRWTKSELGIKGESARSEEDISPERMIPIRISDKEKRLLKFFLAIVICFSFSYVPAVIVTPLSLTVPNAVINTPYWLHYLIVVNAFCGSLWNPFLYFLRQLCSRRKPRQITQSQNKDKESERSITNQC